jgi:tyrosyl-tRNA synthetase
MNFGDLLTRGVDEIIPEKDFVKALKSDRPLRLKLGVDPSSPDIHLGHAVVLRKLRKLQDMGHTVIFLIGDATARIGDPSGKNKTRPVLTEEQIEANAKTYLDQVGKILDTKKAELRRNSEWLDKLSFTDVLKLTANFTVAQLIEREDFKSRLDAGSELALHELLYPVMQAYDSVMLEADVEFGGSDQRFNMLAGRDLQKKMGQRPQSVFMCKLMVGTDGSQKMSKSLGNYIALNDGPVNMFGKVMSIPDGLIGPYYELATDIEQSVIDELVKTLAAGANPRDAKASLAREIVRLYHGEEAALKADEAWRRQFSEREKPAEIPPFELNDSDWHLVDLLVVTELAPSKSEARRLIAQNGVKYNDEPMTEDAHLTVKNGDVIQVGKRRYLELILP